jgi:hypothetical protein
MDILEAFQYFLKTETPFLLMFALLFLYVLKTNRDREISQDKHISKKLDKIQENQEIMIQVWKILIEKELEERKK